MTETPDLDRTDLPTERPADGKNMGIERRFFSRTNVAVDGMLSWTGRGRFGSRKPKSMPVKTIDLSVDGAKVQIDPKADLELRQQCELTFVEATSPAIVRDVISKADGGKVICLQLHQPSSEFLRLIDQWLVTNVDHERVESRWLNNPFA